MDRQDGKVRRFHSLKTELGIPRLLSLSIFNDPSNGYLIDDCCVFGVDVFVIKCRGKGESFSIINEPDDGTFTWKLENFSRLKDDKYWSKRFTVGGHQWKLELHPRGRLSGKGDNLSLYMDLEDYSALRPGSKLYVEYKLIIKDQVHGDHHEYEGGTCDGDWFCSSSKSWGCPKFISLSDLNDAKKGFIVKDTLIVKVKISLITVVNHFA